VGVAIVALVGYPAPATQEALYWLAVVLLGGCAVLAWVSARVPALQAPTIRRLSILFGVLCGACWIVEMVTANLVPVPKGDGLTAYLIVYRGATWVALALPLVAGFVAARATGRIGAGTSVGFWSGLICGLIGFLTLMFLTYTFLGTFQHYPQTLSQYAHSHGQQPDLSLNAFIVGDSLFGSVSHLLIVGVVWGTAVGAMGALVGRAFRRRRAALAKAGTFPDA